MSKFRISGWRSLRQSRPGHRFQERYQRHGRDGSMRSRLLVILPAIGLIIAGIILMPIPGPGSLVVVLGLALLAGVSLKVARFLDWGELRLRRLARRGRRRWQQSSSAARIGLAVLILICLAAAGYAAYRVVF